MGRCYWYIHDTIIVPISFYKVLKAINTWNLCRTEIPKLTIICYNCARLLAAPIVKLCSKLLANFSKRKCSKNYCLLAWKLLLLLHLIDSSIYSGVAAYVFIVYSFILEIEVRTQMHISSAMHPNRHNE